VSETSPPIQLPLIQSGLAGNWYGQGVANNMFDPAGLYGVITLTFNPDPGQCALPATAIISVSIVVENGQDVFVPNIFSPNGDGINDVVTLNSNSKIQAIKSLRIFDRWGEVISEQKNFPPNDPKFGWDGSYRGKEMNPGVYVWLAEVEYDDGHIKFFSDEVTLIR